MVNRRRQNGEERSGFISKRNPDNQKREGGHHKGRQGRGDEGVTAGPGAGVRQEARGAWWQGPGLGGAALTGPRGPGAAGPYGEQ